ncbi:P-loop containing nucleoside triphosphate hydrolase [Pseudocohnilembus persalinus]|uniref:p-loop containing nucleoside triphosphate hydrolase n=1 Tax=Pseudocohnilembus persalinus TaxID=266149 RepID=A0A0V0QUG9_PSEPJ|nr:P-loop containing nucleoside triphosphate hydrolase [Pseudocohnilembus persalinus]|eukprot:KRX05883.1 P-loop containing nucleoside triphosphate hydrolase [Pseudocohnilembus persalinus]
MFQAPVNQGYHKVQKNNEQQQQLLFKSKISPNQKANQNTNNQISQQNQIQQNQNQSLQLLKQNSQQQQSQENIQVHIRVRPLNSKEIRMNHKEIVQTFSTDKKKIVLSSSNQKQHDYQQHANNSNNNKVFYFDWVADQESSQQDIFQNVGQPFALQVLEGYNTCIFCYGQTGAGKTFTMQGNLNDPQSENRGLQIRVFEYLFSLFHQMKNEDRLIEYIISASYYEIYNEQIMDLLSPTGAILQVREDIKTGVYIVGLQEESIESAQDAINLLNKGARNRHVGSTEMNLESSRSHSVFTLHIETKSKLDNSMIVVKNSRMNFVDLAGSERQQLTQAQGERLKEANNINKSLTVLGKVINFLVEQSQGKSRHIPYRDSKLTFILKDSLGGNSKTCIIATISPSISAYSETLSTLHFAQRAKLIQNRAQINEESSGTMEILKGEISRLKNELQNAELFIQEIKNNGQLSLIKADKEKDEIEVKQKQIQEQKESRIDLDLEEQEKQNEKNFLQKIQALDKEKEQFQQTLDNLQLQEISLQTYLAKKDMEIDKLNKIIEQYALNEIHYRTIIELYQQKFNRELKKDVEIQKQQKKLSEEFVNIEQGFQSAERNSLQKSKIKSLSSKQSSPNKNEYNSENEIDDDPLMAGLQCTYSSGNNKKQQQKNSLFQQKQNPISFTQYGQSQEIEKLISDIEQQDFGYNFVNSQDKNQEQKNQNSFQKSFIQAESSQKSIFSGYKNQDNNNNDVQKLQNQLEKLTLDLKTLQDENTELIYIIKEKEYNITFLKAENEKLCDYQDLDTEIPTSQVSIIDEIQKNIEFMKELKETVTSSFSINFSNNFNENQLNKSEKKLDRNDINIQNKNIDYDTQKTNFNNLNNSQYDASILKKLNELQQNQTIETEDEENLLDDNISKLFSQTPLKSNFFNRNEQSALKLQEMHEKLLSESKNYNQQKSPIKCRLQSCFEKDIKIEQMSMQIESLKSEKQNLVGKIEDQEQLQLNQQKKQKQQVQNLEEQIFNLKTQLLKAQAEAGFGQIGDQSMLLGSNIKNTQELFQEQIYMEQIGKLENDKREIQQELEDNQKNKQKEIKQLQEKIDLLNDQIQVQIEEREKINKINQEKQENLVKYDKELNALGEQIKQIKLENCSKFSQMDSEIDYLRKDNEELNYEKQKLQEEFSTLSSALQLQEEQTEEKAEENQKLKEKLLKTEQEKESQTLQIKNLEKQYLNLKKEINDNNQNQHQKELHQALEKDIENLKSENHNLRVQIQEQSEQNQKIREERQHSINEDVLCQKDSQIQSLEEEIIGHKQFEDQLKNEITTVRQMLEKTKKEKFQFQDDSNFNKERLDRIQATLREQINEKEEIKKERIEKDKLIKQLQDEKINYEAKLKTLQQCSKDVMNVYNSKKEEFQKVQILYKTQQEQLQLVSQNFLQQEKKIDILNKKLEMTDQKNEELLKDIDEIYKKYKKIQKKQNKIKNQKTNKKNEIENLEQEIIDMRERMRGIIDYVVECETFVLDIQKQSEEDLQQFENRGKELKELQEKIEEKQKVEEKYEKIIKEQTDFIQQIKTKQSDLQFQNEHLNNEIQELQKLKYSSAIEFEKNQEIEKLKLEISQLESNLNFTKDQKEKKISKLEKEIEQKMETIKISLDQMDKMCKNFGNKQFKPNNLHKQLRLLIDEEIKGKFSDSDSYNKNNNQNQNLNNKKRKNKFSVIDPPFQTQLEELNQEENSIVNLENQGIKKQQSGFANQQAIDHMKKYIKLD